MSNSFYPVVAGRVSDALNRTRSLSQLQYDQIGLNKLQTQLASGHRFTKPGEDPSAAIRILALQRTQENKQQRLVNLNSADNYLSVTESALANTSDLLNEAKSLASEAVSNVQTDSSRQALAFQIDQQISQLVNFGNTSFQDRYLFAGGLTRTKPFTINGQSVAFAGNSLALQTVGDESALVAHNVDALSAFGVQSQGIIGKTDLNTNLSVNTQLKQLNGGVGIQPGAIKLSDGLTQTTLDLADTHRIADVLDRINSSSLGGRQLQASINGNHLQIQFADGAGGALHIDNVGAGRTASELGLKTPGGATAIPFEGGDLNPKIDKLTPLSLLDWGNGLDVSGGIKIRQGDKTFTVDFTGAETVEDLLTAINKSGAAVQASITPNGKSLQVKSLQSGTDFSISEATGDLAQRLGLNTFDGTTQLSELNHGQGFFPGDGADLEITRADGSLLQLDLSGATTIDDIIAKINSDANNLDPTLAITASINRQNNSLQLTAAELPPPATSQPIRIRNAGGSQAASGLGLIAKDQTESIATVDAAGQYSIVGHDANPHEVSGVFNTLLRLRNAILSGDDGELQRAAGGLDADLDHITNTRGKVGIQQQSIETLRTRNEDQILSVKAATSELFDTDFAAAVTELNSRQTAYQASLKLIADLNKLSLFNYL